MLVIVGLGLLVRRDFAFRRFARAHNLLYSRDDVLALADAPFRLLTRGGGGSVTRELWGMWNGVPVKVADHSVNIRSTDTESPSALRRRFTVAIVGAGSGFPFVSVRPQRMAAAIGERIGLHDLAFESERFNQKFEVRADERVTAYQLVDARMMEWLLGEDDRFGYESGASGILAYASGRLKSSELAALLDAATGFAQRVPRMIRTIHPADDAMATFAKEHGLAYAVEDPHALRERGFELFRLGGSSVVRNVAWGPWHGVDIHAAAADVELPLDPSSETVRALWIGLADVDRDLPDLALVSLSLLPESSPVTPQMARSAMRWPELIERIRAEEQEAERKGRSSRAAKLRRRRESMERMTPQLARLASEEAEGESAVTAMLGMPVGSDELRRAFLIRGDEAFGSRAVDETLSRWLLSEGLGFGFEMSGRSVLGYCRRTDIDQLGTLLNRTLAFQQRIMSV